MSFYERPHLGNHIVENGRVIATFESREDAELFRTVKRVRDSLRPDDVASLFSADAAAVVPGAGWQSLKISWGGITVPGVADAALRAQQRRDEQMAQIEAEMNRLLWGQYHQPTKCAKGKFDAATEADEPIRVNQGAEQ